jgi:2,5-dioxopentanoate dehydrogenase
MRMISGKHLIGYTISAESGQTFSGQGGLVKDWEHLLFHEASVQEIDHAVHLAARAFEDYRNLPGSRKAFFLREIAQSLSDRRQEIVALAAQETHLSSVRLDGEVQRTINQLLLFVELLEEGSWVNAIIDTARPARMPLPKQDIRQMQVPLGPVAVFGASNFPFAFSVAGGDTVSALAAGCTVIYKAHPAHPATSERVGLLLLEAARKSAMPEGVFSLLQGASYASSLALVEHPQLRAVAFTGSLAGGRALFDAAAKRPSPIPVYAEMGSTNPVFILPEILEQDPKGLAEKLAASNTVGSGQFCTNPGLLILPASPHTSLFQDHFLSEIQKTTNGTMLSAKIHSGYQAHLKEISRLPGIETASGPEKNDAPWIPASYMVKTTASVFLNEKSLQEEIFGPCSVQVLTGSPEELMEVAGSLQGQLTISVWGTENELINHKPLLQKLSLRAGRMICNAVPTGVEVTHAMVHGGPYPATTDSRTTSVGTNAIYRFTRAECFQNYPQSILEDALLDENPLRLWRKIDGKFSRDAINKPV